MKLRNVIVSLVLAGVLFTGVMGFAHTKAGRPLLAAMGRLMGKQEFCPLGYDRTASAEDREKVRERLRLAHAKLSPVESRPSLDFELGVTSRADILRWTEANHGTCKDLAGGFDSECTGPFFNSRTSTVWVEFDRSNRLVSLRGIEKFADRNEAWAFFLNHRQTLSEKTGKPVAVSGVKMADDLSPSLAQAQLVAEFRNFSASTRVTNVGDGFVVTQDDKSF